MRDVISVVTKFIMMLLRMKRCHTCDVISGVTEFMVDVAEDEALPYVWTSPTLKCSTLTVTTIIYMGNDMLMST
jgi:hypothetical protein